MPILVPNNILASLPSPRLLWTPARAFVIAKTAPIRRLSALQPLHCPSVHALRRVLATSAILSSLAGPAALKHLASTLTLHPLAARVSLYPPAAPAFHHVILILAWHHTQYLSIRCPGIARPAEPPGACQSTGCSQTAFSCRGSTQCSSISRPGTSSRVRSGEQRGHDGVP